MARITVIGGTGYAGSGVVKAAVARGHEVTSYSRSLPEQQVAGVRYKTGSVLEEPVARAAVEGADVVVVALSRAPIWRATSPVRWRSWPESHRRPASAWV